jgi:transcriptional regulator with XRE-family HTH domain
MPENRPVELWEVAPNTLRVTLGEDIRDARERAQLTQPELGKLVGVSEGTISNWERGVVKAPKNRLARVWEVLRDFREPTPGRGEPQSDDFDPAALLANLTPEQLARLAEALPDVVIAEDVSRRLRRADTPINRVGDRAWKRNTARTESPDERPGDTGVQPA